MQPFRFRALDLLSTKSRYVGTPIGGRIPGQLNINTITDLNLFNALLNPTGGSTHDSTYVTNLQANVTTSRNSNPFWSAHRTNNFEQTLFRSAPGSMMPTLFEMINNPTVLPTAIQHPYSAQEPARRMWNNITTTSDGFLILFTVGVFEVTDPTGGPGDMPRLGAEMFKSVKGDLRQQFAAVVDRSMMSIDTVGSTTIGREPWEVDLAADAEVGSNTIIVRGFGVGPTATSFQVYRNGQPVTVNANEQIHLGFGAASNNTGDGETLTISAFAAGPEAGTVTLTLTTPLSRFHGAGSPVRNTILGNPGPQPNFSHRDRRYHGVLPYFTRIDP
jgi:hypothetical protein